MRRDLKKQATRDLLIQAALELFGSQGYEQTTVQQITQMAGVAKGTFFNYFESKEDILRKLGMMQEEWAVAELEELAEEEQSPLAPQLIEIMVELAERFQFTPRLMRALLNSVLASPGGGAVQAGQGLVAGLTPIFTLGQERGEFTRDFPAGRLAVLAVQSYYCVLASWTMNPEPRPLEEAMAETFQLFFYGAASRPAL